MRGTCYRRGTTWTIRYDLPRGADGRRRQQRASGYRTEGAARAALDLHTMPLGWRDGRVPHLPMPAPIPRLGHNPDYMTLSDDEWLALQLSKAPPPSPAQLRRVARILTG